MKKSRMTISILKGFLFLRKMVIFFTLCAFCSMIPLKALGNGPLWITSGRDLFRVSPEGKDLFRVGGTLFMPSGLVTDARDGHFWMVDWGHNELVKYAPDGKELFRVDGFQFSNDSSPSVNIAALISMDNRNGCLWVADTFNNDVVKMSPDGKEIFRKSVGPWVSAVAVDQKDGSCWVAADRYVFRLAENGEVISKSGKYSLLALTLAVNPFDRSCWVATHMQEGYLGFIFKLSLDGKEVFDLEDWSEFFSLFIPDPKDGGCFVVSSNHLYKMDKDGKVIFTVKDIFPMSMTVNAKDETIWGVTYKGCLFKLSMKGDVLWKSKPLINWSELSAIACHPSDGSCWVADAYGDRLMKFDHTGKEITRIENRLKRFTEIAANPLNGSVIAVDDIRNKIVSVDKKGAILFEKDIPLKDDPRYVELVINKKEGSFWLTDSETIFKCSPEGEVLFTLKVEDYPQLAVDPYDGALWYVTLKKLYKVDRFGKMLLTIDLPGAYISLNPNDRTVWVGLYENDRITHLSYDGKVLAELKGTTPYQMTASPFNDSLWVLEKKNRQILNLSTDGTLLSTHKGLNHLSHMEALRVDGSLWYMSMEKVLKYSKDGKKLVDWKNRWFKWFSTSGTPSMALPKRPSVPYLPLIFNNSETESLDIKGSENSFSGSLHSHSDIAVEGEGHLFSGELSASGKIFLDEGVKQHVPLINGDYPHTMPVYVMAEYEKLADHIHENHWEIEKRKKLLPGIHFVKGDCTIEADKVAGSVTIVATGKITIKGGGHRLSPSDKGDGMLLFAQKGVTIKGENAQFEGVIYSPDAHCKIKGSNLTFKGSVIAEKVTVKGDQHHIEPLNQTSF